MFLLFTILFPRLIWCEPPSPFLGEPKVGVETVRSLMVSDIVMARRTIALFPVYNLCIWKEGRYHNNTVLPAERVKEIRDNVYYEMEKTLKDYDCYLITADECTSKIVQSLKKENRPNPVDDLAAYPGMLLSIIPKYVMELPRAGERQKKISDLHKRAVKAVGKYLGADFILTACLVYEEKDDQLYVFFEVYDTATSEVMLHVVGAGSYANSMNVEKDAVESGLKVGLERLGLMPLK